MDLRAYLKETTLQELSFVVGGFVGGTTRIRGEDFTLQKLNFLLEKNSPMGSHKAHHRRPKMRPIGSILLSFSGGGRLLKICRNSDRVLTSPRASDQSDATQPPCGRSEREVAEERGPFD
ncbi:hypothetical protein [Leptospira barantonii]|uniref:Uncharacterized protein n=1 Tax=Leptospira barantonii TaxID=2023184 RepID=A0ABX4NUB1_9LEPT|nr:hypothetical protein [Leptospira barantonii]PJZ59202.1 hypothetical protein CH367_04060 [Leptospira barantonii]